MRAEVRKLRSYTTNSLTWTTLWLSGWSWSIRRSTSISLCRAIPSLSMLQCKVAEARQNICLEHLMDSNGIDGGSFEGCKCVDFMEIMDKPSFEGRKCVDCMEIMDNPSKCSLNTPLFFGLRIAGQAQLPSLLYWPGSDMTISQWNHLRKTGEVVNVNRGQKMVFSHSGSIISTEEVFWARAEEVKQADCTGQWCDKAEGLWM